MLDILELQKKLVKSAGPSGSEINSSKLLAELSKPYVDESFTDCLGNLIAHKKGNGKKIMFTAHMDTIGFMAMYIDKSGYIRFDGIGEYNPALLIGRPVRFINGVRGCIGYDKANELNEKKVGEIKISDLFIDIGASNYEQASAVVKVGDAAVFEGEPCIAQNGNIISPYCDNFIACIVLLNTMKQIQKTDNDIYFVFSAQGEVGMRGAQTAAYQIQPDMAVVVNITGADSSTETEKSRMPVCMGKGPAIIIKDSSAIYNKQVIEHLRKAADLAGIAYQNEILRDSGADAAAMQRSGGGVLSGCISVGAKYIHTPAEMVNIKDVEAAASILAQAAVMEF